MKFVYLIPHHLHHTNLVALGDFGKTAVGQLASNLAGGAAGVAASGGNVENYLKNQIMSQGIGALTNMAGSTANQVFGPRTTEIVSQLAPLIQSKRLTPEQVIMLAMTLGKTQTGGTTPPPKG